VRSNNDGETRVYYTIKLPTNNKTLTQTRKTFPRRKKIGPRFLSSFLSCSLEKKEWQKKWFNDTDTLSHTGFDANKYLSAPGLLVKLTFHQLHQLNSKLGGGRTFWGSMYLYVIEQRWKWKIITIIIITITSNDYSVRIMKILSQFQHKDMTMTPLDVRFSFTWFGWKSGQMVPKLCSCLTQIRSSMLLYNALGNIYWLLVKYSSPLTFSH